MPRWRCSGGRRRRRGTRRGRPGSWTDWWVEVGVQPCPLRLQADACTVSTLASMTPDLSTRASPRARATAPQLTAPPRLTNVLPLLHALCTPQTHQLTSHETELGSLEADSKKRLADITEARRKAAEAQEALQRMPERPPQVWSTGVLACLWVRNGRKWWRQRRRHCVHAGAPAAGTAHELWCAEL